MRDMKCWFQTFVVAKIDSIDILKSNHFSKLSRMQQKTFNSKIWNLFWVMRCNNHDKQFRNYKTRISMKYKDIYVHTIMIKVKEKDKVYKI